MRLQPRLKKPTNLSLDQTLLKEARSLGINFSRAAEAGLREAVSHAKSELWKKENTEALNSSNTWVERHGLPLEKYRKF